MTCSRITPRLYVGSAPETTEELEGFDLLVLCAAEWQPQSRDLRPWRGRVLHAGFEDTPAPDTLLVRKAKLAAREVATALKQRRRVLVTCAAGLNRSALVAGLALRSCTRLPPEEIVARIRAARGPDALCNKAFAEIVGKPRSARSAA